MDEGSLHTDGNAIAGLLAEIFAADVTATPRTCQSCGTTREIGAHRAYFGAGIVLRCAGCGDVAARIVSLPEGHVVELRGSWVLRLP